MTFRSSPQPLGPAPVGILQRMIASAQADLAWESPVRIHAQQAPKLLDADGVTTHYPDEGGIGLPFTAEFHRLLALRERFDPAFLMELSFDEVADWCHARHPTHVRPGERRPICAYLMERAVKGNAGWADLCRDLGMSEARMRSTLANALEHGADWRSGQRDRLGVTFSNPLAEETLPERLRREHDLRIEEHAWTRLRAKYSTLSPWDDELRRRRADHARFDCPNCGLLVAA